MASMAMLLRCNSPAVFFLPSSPFLSSHHQSMESLRAPIPVSFKTSPRPPPPRAPPAPVLLVTASSAMDSPLLWAVRTCVLYAFVQLGICGAAPNSLQGDEVQMQQPQWLQTLLGKTEAKELKRVKSKWHTTTKGTLKRSYRVPTKAEGRRLLNLITSLLSDDDTFRDATSHKGCQIRRENAHAETVCCNNVRAMFDELPTPHLVIEITAFPSGSITTADYEKAEKIEKLLKRGHSI